MKSDLSKMLSLPSQFVETQFAKICFNRIFLFTLSSSVFIINYKFSVNIYHTVTKSKHGLEYVKNFMETHGLYLGKAPKTYGGGYPHFWLHMHIWCLDDNPSHFQLAIWAKWFL